MKFNPGDKVRVVSFFNDYGARSRETGYVFTIKCRYERWPAERGVVYLEEFNDGFVYPEDCLELVGKHPHQFRNTRFGKFAALTQKLEQRQ